MAMVVKRLRAVCLALAFLVGLTAQLLPPSMPEAQMTVRADMAGGCSGPQPPCTGHMPNCVDHVCCVTVFALPASLASVAVAFEWASLDYDRAPVSLSGISVKPELSPPILAAWNCFQAEQIRRLDWAERQSQGFVEWVYRDALS
jgi:hypothetical protein